MRAAEIAREIDHRRFIRAGRPISRENVCEVAQIIAGALRAARDRAPTLRFIYRAGLGLAISALEEYRAQRCRDEDERLTATERPSL